MKKLKYKTFYKPFARNIHHWKPDIEKILFWISREDKINSNPLESFL